MERTRRATAWFIDAGLVGAVASGLAVLTFHRISALFTEVPGLATRGALDLLASRGDVLDASRSFGGSQWDRSVLYVEQGLVLLVLAAFLYQWGCVALLGRTLGKGLVGLRVGPVPPRRAARRAAAATAVDLVLFAVACVLLVEGRIVLSVLVRAVAVLLLNALFVLAPGRRSPADRAAGTTVTGSRLSRPGATAPGRTSSGSS
ncbi:RDD family protein [Streptomyces sp. SHP 1-2]|uniref:RDD family protein n=1 Tax=Streptomyces sp. SHP 1-2 TaxID=2769489 RepID=UPI0022377AF4|nr:RDD family protein [Streptomyces sp. SHP 1-2]MCW5249221.1 RDD family protein [Streptomyces sp. SHP 1-2]